MQQVEGSIARHMDALDTADRTQPADLQVKTTRLQDKLVKLRKPMTQLRDVETELGEQLDQRRSQTDPDARSMATSGSGVGMVGYKVQIAVDTKHHMIVATEVINEGHDRASLRRLAQDSREAVGEDKLESSEASPPCASASCVRRQLGHRRPGPRRHRTARRGTVGSSRLGQAQE